MPADTQKILVLGGTGHYGSKVTEKLLRKNVIVKVLTRNIPKARDILGENVLLFEGDVTDRNIIKQCLADTDGIIICLSAVSPQLIRRIRKIEKESVIMVMEEASKSDIKRLVYFSGYDMRPEVLKKLKIADFGEIKLDIESRIQHSDFNWTILGCAPSFELFFSFLRNNKLLVPGGGFNRIPSISTEDVSEIAAQVILRNDLNGIRFRLTGPDAFNFPQVASLFSDITGKKINHQTIPLSIINFISAIIYPVNPFFRYIYKGVKLFNNFPVGLAENVPEDHKKLRDIFDYSPVTLEMEAKKRLL
jgi:uncharacterized protein YbjT (DUF2867 family)